MAAIPCDVRPRFTGVGASFGIWQGYKAVYLTQVFC